MTATLAKGIMATVLTAEQMKADSGREYNCSIWERNVDSYMKYKDVKFFRVERDDCFQYERYFVQYTLPEGLRLLGSFGYSSSITSGGFQMAFILDADIVGGQLFFLPENTVRIHGRKIRFAGGEEGWLNTSKESRKFMIERSQKGLTFTKEGI